MFSPLLFALTLVAPADRVVVGPSTLTADEPPVRIWLNGDRRFEPGDGARVQVEARDDGYLLVLNFDTDGRVRVLFPLDPSDDGFVRGGRRYEVRTERERNSFSVGDAGSGFVYVALAPDPWRLRDWSRANLWDYDRIAIDFNSADPERDLTSLVESISSNRGFDYDILEYFVEDVDIVRYEYQPRYFAGPGIYSFDPTCDPFWSSGWYCGSRSGLILSYGRFYGNDWWSIGYGPSWYWPSRYGYYYNSYPYGRGNSYIYSYYRPWIVTGPTSRPGYNSTFLAGRSRDYEVRGSTPWTFGNTAVSGRPSGASGDDYRPRPQAGSRARPVTQRATSPAEESRGRPSVESRGRPAVDRSADQGNDRGRPSAGSARPTGRPAASPPSTQRSPTASRPPASQPTRSRARGGRGNEEVSTAARTVPSAGRVASSPSGSSRSAPVKTAAPAPSRRVSSPPPATRSAPSRASAPARSAPPSSASRAGSSSKAPPSRSRTRPPA